MVSPTIQNEKNRKKYDIGKKYLKMEILNRQIPTQM